MTTYQTPYKPSGFNNLGATPGVIPQTKVNPTPDWKAQLTEVSNFKPTGTIKKVVTSDGTQVHYDNSLPAAGTNPGLLKPNLASGGLTEEQKAAGDKRTAELNSGSANENLTQGVLPANSPAIPTTYPGLVSGAANLAQGNLNIGKSAKDIGASYGQKIADVGQQGANYQAGALSTGTSPVGEGNAAVNAAATAAKQTALATGEQAALAGTGQQLTAQNQAQTGVLGAATAVKPELGQYGQNYYNPLTGTTGGASTEVQPTDPFYKTMQTYANMLVSGQSASVPSAVTSNPVLNAQLQNMAKTINPNYNASIAGAQGSSLDKLTGDKITIQTTAEGAKNNMQLAINIAKQIPNIKNNVPAINAIQQAIASNLATPESLPAFQTQIASIKKAYDDLGIPAEGIADWNNITIDQLNNLAANIDKNVGNKTGAIDTQIKQITSGGSSTSNSSGSSAPVKIGNSSFEQVNGVWTVKK